MYAFVLDSFPLLCLYVWLFPKKKKKLTKNKNDRIIAFGETNIIVNKRIVERLWTKKEKNFDFASPFFSLISIFMSKRNLKKKIEVYMMCQNSSILLILPILAPKRRWNKIHLGLWLAKYDACARWKHKCIALIFPETKPLKLGVFFFFSIIFWSQRNLKHRKTITSLLKFEPWKFIQPQSLRKILD